MSAPATPTQNTFYVQQGNNQVLASWAIVPTATSYIVQRSLDGVNFTTVATLSGVPLSTSYLDTTVTPGILYWYQVAASNISGTSAYTTPIAITPSTTGEMSLGSLRLAAQQRADRVNSNYVTVPEWNSYINQSMFELYDILVDVYEDYFIATPAQFTANGTTYLFPLPDGITPFINSVTNTPNYIAPPFYKVLGLDLAINNAANAWVTINKFNFIDRNRFVYPNTASTIYGVFNLQYRVLGNSIEFVPTPSAGQNMRIWYIPRIAQLLKDTDTTIVGISGWIEYIIVKAAYLALTKEESDTTPLMQQLVALTKRIEESAANRDAGQPDRISDVRQNGQWNPYGTNGGWGGPMGGF